ncbi:hypothetical protein GCM10020220_114980 [Nonomuraea rubra]
MGDEVRGHGQVREAEVGPLVPDGADDAVAAVAAHDVHAYAWMLGRVGGQQPPRETGLEAGGGRDAELRVGGCALVGQALDLVNRVECLPRQLDHPASLRGDDHSAPGTGEQRHAELALEIADRAGQRRLRDVERPGRVGHGAVLRSRDHIAELLEIHAKEARTTPAARTGR